MARWDRKYNPSVLVQELEKSRSINSEGKAQFGGFGIMTISPKLEAMLSMNPEITLEDKHEIVQQSIFNVGNSGALSPKAILAEINRFERDYSSSCEQNYILATSLSVNKDFHKLPNVQIDKNRITFSASLPKSFAKAIGNHQSINFHMRKKLPFNYLIARVSVRAKSIYWAVEKALVSLNIFRGILNFVINYGHQTFSFGVTNRKPINQILLGPIHTLHKPNGEIAIQDLFWYEEGYQEAFHPYHNNTIVNNVKQFDWIIKSVYEIRKNIQKSKIIEELQNAILLYNDALDSYNYEVTYIKLWAVLELLTATERGENHEVTIRRAAFIFNNPRQEKMHLDLLRNFRNNLVHRGYMNAKLEIFVYDLKLYVEKLLRFLIFNQSRFESFSDVGYLLDRNTEADKLDKSSKLINFAKKLNKSRNPSKRLGTS
jgi:hypothetical protein